MRPVTPALRALTRRVSPSRLRRPPPGWSVANSRAIRSRSILAVASVVPGARRPIALSQRSPRDPVASNLSGLHAAASPGKRKPAGITPTIRNGPWFTRTVRPMIAGSAPNRSRQSPSLRITTLSPRRRFSSGTNVRPSAARTPRTENRSVDTSANGVRSRPSSADRMRDVSTKAAIDVNARLRSRKSSRFSGDVGKSSPSGFSSQMRTSRSGSSNDSGRSTTASSTLKIAVVAPMPSASVPTIMAVNPGRRRSMRSA